MKEIEFNLLDEKWIRVRLPDNTVREVSLTEALIYSHEYADLAGETATQDAAILRLLLAVPLTVFYRVNAQGEENPLTESDEALIRWKEIWDLGQLPEAPIREYLQKWHERFWLFHPKRPFWQVPEAKDGTYYGAAKLNGELSESSNKIRLFPLYSGEEKSAMSYSQAARWLLNLNAYDDTSSKPKGKNLPSVGAGWLGKIGFIQAQGNNLFETLMLNLTLLQDRDRLWDENVPCWELDAARSGERTEIPLPAGLAQLYTLQSRRLLLYREGDKVTGFSLLGGDFFQRENAFAEQMTVWRGVKAKKDQPVVFVPARHDPSKQFWREFPTVFYRASDDVHKPGIVQWISLLQSKRLRFLDPKRYMCFKISSMQYGDKDFFVNDSFSDALLFQAALIDDMETAWQARITSEIERCDNVARQIAYFAQELEMAAGSKNANLDSAKAQFYFNIDKPFREWLGSIDTQQDDRDEKVLEWQRKSKSIAMEMAKDMVRKAGAAAFIGRSVKREEKNGSEHIELYAAPKAFNKFCNGLWKIYPEN